MTKRPTPSTSEGPSPDFTRLVEWVREHGGQVDKRLDLALFDGVRGIGAVEEIESGALLLSCPWSLVLGARGPGEGDSPCEILAALEQELREGPESFWHPYLGMLEEGGTRIPTAWDAHSVGELQGLPPHDPNRSATWYSVKCLGGAEISGFDAIHWKALLTYVTRIAESGLVPVFDLINHHTGERNVSMKEAESGFQLFAARTILAGEQVYTSYRRGESVSDLFLDYGFIEPWPQLWSWKDEADQVHSFVRFPDEAIAIEPPREFIEAMGKGPLALEEWQSRAREQTLALSVGALGRFLEAGRQWLKDLPTTAAEDGEILEEIRAASVASPIARNKRTDLISCVNYRREFKIAVAEAVSAAGEVIDAIRIADPRRARSD